MLLEERGYIAGKAWLFVLQARLYFRNSTYIFLKECSYIVERVWLYCRKRAVILPEERGYVAGGAWL